MSIYIFKFCLIFYFLNLFGSLNGAPEKDRILHLPGLNDIITFKHYSGYLDGNDGDHLHYWFVESSLNPAKDPIILWMNGGPGCSSLDGLLNELGPYILQEDGDSFQLNTFSWNKIANVLFLEAPACVGFSYKEHGDCTTSDDRTSLSNYMAIKSFFKKFPEYRKNPFFITGESYAGIYVPTLTVRVIQGNSDFPINLKGFAVGNGLSSFELNDKSIIFFAYYHGLIGDKLWNDLVSSCCKSGIASEDNCDFSVSSEVDPNCHSLTMHAMNIIYNRGLNMYNLYGKCLHPKSLNGTSRYYHDKHNALLSVRGTQRADRKKTLQLLKLDPPCTDSTNMRKYLNRKDVQKAIHVKPITYDICNDEVNANYITQYQTMKKQYEFLVQHVPGLIYNGDVDMACNFLGDEWFSESLNLTEKEPRRMWYFDDQVGGFVKRFENLDVLTVRGAGHMVPQDKPGPAFKMISTFIKGKDY